MSDNSLSKAIDNAKAQIEANEALNKQMSYTQALNELIEYSKETEKRITIKTEGKDGKDHLIEIGFNKEKDKAVVMVDGKKMSNPKMIAKTMDVVDKDQKFLSEGRACEMGKAFKIEAERFANGDLTLDDCLAVAENVCKETGEPMNIAWKDPETGKTNSLEIKPIAVKEKAIEKDKVSVLSKVNGKVRSGMKMTLSLTGKGLLMAGKKIAKNVLAAAKKSIIKTINTTVREAQKEYQMG